MPKIQFKNLEEADQALAQFEEAHANSGPGVLVSAKAILPFLSAIRKLIEEVKDMKSKSN
jgi:hypothetical protein